MPLPGLHRIALVVNGSEVASVNWEGVPVSPRLAKNVILFIGDGMNNALITATRAVSRGFNKVNGQYNGKLNMQTMQKMGMVSTAGYDSIMPDSANTASSIASGSKGVVNGLGVYGDTDTSDPFDDARVELITELAQRKYGSDFGLGVVTTSEIQDATPAAFFSHSRFRAQKADITRQLFEGFEGGPSTPSSNELYASKFTVTPDFDVIMGGGAAYFDTARTFNTTDALGNVLCCSTALVSGACPKTSTLLSTNCGVEGSALVPVSSGWSGLKNFYSDAQTKYGFSLVQNRSALMKQTQKASKVLGMFHKGNMDVWVDRQKKPQNIAASNTPLAASSFLEVNARTAPLDQPDLSEMTDAAIKILSKRGKSGFFLMVEGASIDKQEHAYDHERVFGEMIDFDNAIGIALQYARANEDTLVITTCDHGHGFDVFGSVDTAVYDEVDKLSADPSVKRLMQTAQSLAQYDSAGFPSYVDTDGDNFPDNFDTARFKLAIGYADTTDMKEDFMSKNAPRAPAIGHELPKAPSTLQVPGVSNSGSGGVSGVNGTSGALPGTGIYASDSVKGLNTHGLPINRNMPDGDADFLKAGIGAHPDSAASSKGFKLIDSTGGSGAHTLQDVPIYAEGPGANLIRTSMDQTDIFFVLANVLGLGGVPQTVSALG